MMKQFKLLSMLLAILVIPMIASCGDDKEKDNTPSGDDLITKAAGTWMCTQSVDTQNGKTYQGLMVGKQITISSNGTYTSTAPSFGYSGTYIVSGNKITAHSDAGDTFLINVSINGDRMTWDGTANNGVTFQYVFERESDIETVTTSEEFFNYEESVLAMYNSCYASCAKFEEEQLNLEKIRTNPNTVHTISPKSIEVRRTWEAAYTTINRVNVLLDNISQFSSLFSNQELNELLAEVRFIRAYVYYNLAILWGNVPLVTTADIDAGTLHPQSYNDVVLDFALTEVRDIIGNLTHTTDKYKVSYEAGQLLLSEIYLQRANLLGAKNALNNVDKQKYEGIISSVTGDVEKPVIWALNLSEEGRHIPVYTYGHILFYEKEIDNDFYSSAAEWQNTVIVDYGYWAMLARTGEAQSKSGCYDYEIYMPFPQSVTQSNPNITQNPGY